MEEVVHVCELTYETLYEECNGYDVKDEEVEDLLSVLLQEVGQGVPLLHKLGAVSGCRRVYAKTLHSERKKKQI